jgi:hypothetical protein
MGERFWWGNLRQRYHSDDLGVDGRIILNGYLRSGLKSMDWIDLAQDRDTWRALLNAVMNLRVQ